MPLLDRYSHPPRGFSYREPKTGWKPKTKGAGFYEVANEILAHRKQNAAKFEASEQTLESAVDDLDCYTCHRLGGDPKWCGPSSMIERRILNEAAYAKPRAKKAGKGCASCGRRKKHS